jgi:hypothetical protein
MNRIHYIGGKAFYKVGGKYIPVAQGGLWFDPTNLAISAANALSNQTPSVTSVPSSTGISGMSGMLASQYESLKNTKLPQSDFSKFMSNKENVNIAGQALGTLANSLGKNTFSKPSGKYVQNAVKPYQSTGFESIANRAVDAAAVLDPTGTSQIVSAGLKIGKGLGNAVAGRDQYGISGSAAQEVASNILDPLGRIQQIINTGKEKGFTGALKDFATFGVYGNNVLKEKVNAAKRRENEVDMGLRLGSTQGKYRNDSIYAKEGKRITPKRKDVDPNVEIEDGEIVLANPEQIVLHGNADTSLESRYAAKYHGDKHGEDTDKDGMEGIPLTSEDEAYVASDYLGLDGKVAKNGKTVAKAIEPYVKQLHRAEMNPEDKYTNNPIAIAHHRKQINKLIDQAEKNKFIEKLYQATKKKDRNFEEVLEIIQNEMPQTNQMSDEQLIMEEAIKQINKEMGPRMQEGGNPSQMRMDQLVKQSMNMGQMQQNPRAQNQMEQMDPNVAGQASGLSPELQELFNQLPPEVQQQIMQLPPEQQEIAIMNFMDQMMVQADPNQQNQMPEAQGEQPMPQNPNEMNDMQMQEQMDPAAMAEQQAIMKMGGDINEHIPRQLRDTFNPIRNSHVVPQTYLDLDRFRSGGKLCNGAKIKFKLGGKVYTGTVTNYDSRTGDFDLI